jgi:hypothetical protein
VCMRTHPITLCASNHVCNGVWCCADLAARGNSAVEGVHLAKQGRLAEIGQLDVRIGAVAGVDHPYGWVAARGQVKL